MGELVQRPLQLFSREKLDEFRDMPLKARLQWLQDANELACKVLGKIRLEQAANSKTRLDETQHSAILSHDKMFAQMQEQVRRNLYPEKIILFGSYAAGTATRESDIDLLIVMKSELPPRKRNLMVKRLFPHRTFALDAFVYTPEEFQRYKDVPGTVVYQAAHHGKLLYGWGDGGDSWTVAAQGGKRPEEHQQQPGGRRYTD